MQTLLPDPSKWFVFPIQLKSLRPPPLRHNVFQLINYYVRFGRELFSWTRYKVPAALRSLTEPPLLQNELDRSCAGSADTRPLIWDQSPQLNAEFQPGSNRFQNPPSQFKLIFVGSISTAHNSNRTADRGMCIG